MDFHSLKRRELQALCKEHNIPANSASSVLADKLSALLNEKQKPITRKRTCMKSLIETTEVGEPAALKRQAKKVRFSPSNDLVEYELRSGEKQKDMVTQIKARRNSAVKKVDNNTTVELVDDSAQIPVKLTRSRVHLSRKDVVISNKEKKQSRREAKFVEKGPDVDKESEGNVGKVTRSKAHTLKIGGGVVQREKSRQSKRLVRDFEKASDSVEETVVSPARVTRSKTQASTEGGTGPDVNPRVKKKSGNQVEKDGKDVEPSKEIMDIPVRATRSRKQTLMEDIGYMVTNPQADVKRPRREMKATDLRSDPSDVAPVDKQEPLKRKLLRTEGMKTVDEDESGKVEVVDEGRVTRSRAPLDMKASGRNSTNITKKVETKQLEEQSRHGGKKNVKRRTSVLQPEKTEVVLHLEEPVSRPARENTRRKAVMQKAFKKVESPTVGKKLSKVQSGNLSMIVEGKDASENELKEVTSGSHKSRKQRGTPVIEDRSIEIEYGSLVDKSPKSSTRCASKSGGKSVAKEQVESSLKKPMSRTNNQSSVENASKGKSWATSSSKKRARLSGTKPSDSEDHDVNSNKEGTPVAKLGNFSLDEEVIEPEVTPAIDKSARRFTHSTIRSERNEPTQSANKEQPIAHTKLSCAKLATFRPDPAVNRAPGRITRSGIKHGGNAAGSFSEKVSKKKQASQSARKKPPLDDAQMASPKVAEVRPNPDVATIGVWSEIKLPLDEVQMSSPEVAEVRFITDVETIAVRSEIKQPCDDVQMRPPEVAEVRSDPDSNTVGVESVTSKVEGQILGDLLASDSVRLPSKIVEENIVSVSETSIDMASVSLVPEEKASGKVMEDAGACIEKSTYEASATPCLTENLVSGKQPNPLELQSFDNETLLGKNLSHIKMASVSISDGSHVQNQNEEVYVESGICSDAVSVETPVLKSGRPDAEEKEMVLTESGPTSKGPEIDLVIEEQLVSVGKVVEVEEGVDISSLGVATKGNSVDVDNNSGPISYDVGKGDVSGDGINVRKGPETGSEPSNDSKTLEVPVSGNDIDIECVLGDNSDVQDGESEHVQLSSNDNPATFEEEAGGDDIEPARKECTPMVAEVLFQSRDQEPGQVLNVAVDDVPCDTVGPSDSIISNDAIKTPATSGVDDMDVRVDALEDSVLDINKDVVSSVLGDIYDTDTEDGSEHKLTEVDEGFQPKGSGGISPDMSNEKKNEDAETSRGNDHTVDDHEQATADNLDSASGKIMDVGSPIRVNKGESELVGNIKANEDPTREEASPFVYTKGESAVDGIDSSQLKGGIGAHGSLITKESLPITYKMEECPVDDTDSDLPTIEEDDRNKQEETRNAGTSVDWGDYDFGMDEFEEPVSASRSAVVVGEDKKDDQDSDLQTFDRTNISIEESSYLGVGLANSVRNLEKDSRNADGGKPKQDVDLLKEIANADMSEEVFNWSDSSLKPLFATPLTTHSNHVKDGQQDATIFANKDHYSSLKPRLTTPTTAQTRHVKDTQEDAANLANKDHYSSPKSLFTTCSTSHVNEGKTDAVNSVDFTFPYGRPSEDMGTSGTAPREFNHPWENDQSKVFDGETETQGNAVRGPENEMYGIPSFEDYPLKLFGDEEVVGSIDRSGRKTHFVLKGDQVDQIKQFEFLSEPAETSHHALSGLKDNCIRSHELEKKEETVMKGSETEDDLAFDTGHV